MPYTTCPACDDEIYLPKKPRLGAVVTCGSCGADFEVVSEDPLELDWLEEEDEDLEDDDWDWEDEEDEE